MTVRLLASMAEVSISVSAVLLALFLLDPLLRKRLSARWRYWIWLALAVRLLIPLNLHLPQPPVRIEVPQGAVLQTASPQSGPQSTGGAAARTPVAAPPQASEGDRLPPDSASDSGNAPRTVPVLQLAAGVWLAGAALLTAQRFAAYFVFRRGARKWSLPAEDAETLAAFWTARSELNLKGAVELRRSGRIAGPMIAGFFRPLLLLPERELPPGELELILRHELIHWKRRDVWYRLLLELACAVHWFNPLVRRMVRKAGEDAELVCDSLVVEGRDGEYRRLYGETILAAVRPGKGRHTAFSTGFSGGARTMRQRLRNIFDTGTKRRGAAAFCLVLLAAGIFGASVACGTDRLPIPADSSPLVSASDAEPGFSTVGEDATPVDADLILSGLGIDPAGCRKIELTDPGLPQSVVQYYAKMDRPIGSTEPAFYESNGDDPKEYLIAFENPDGEGEIHCLIFSSGSSEPRVQVMTGLTNVRGNDTLPKILYTVPDGLLSADPDVAVTNGWEGAKTEENRTVVLLGAMKLDPEQGAAVVLSVDPEDESKILDRTRVLTPEKHGSIRVTTLGAKDFAMTAAADDGYYWTFNVYNGFSGGHQPDAKAPGTPVPSVSSGSRLTPFDSDADAQKFQTAAEKFTWAYLSADLTTMKAMLTDPQSSQHDFALGDRSDGIERLALKVYADQITPDFIPAEVEIIPKTGDSHDFLYLKIKKVNADWKVISYALEK